MEQCLIWNLFLFKFRHFSKVHQKISEEKVLRGALEDIEICWTNSRPNNGAMYFDRSFLGKQIVQQHTQIVIVELVDRKTSKKYISPLLSLEKHVQPLMDGEMNDVPLMRPMRDFVFWNEAFSYQDTQLP